MAKEKKESRIKKFFGEFKKFITRGNVLDMAVGVIVGGAFTAIVNGLSNFILKPLINALLAILLKGEGLEGAVTMLVPAYLPDNPTVIDLASSIYIDWGAFISAIINFLLTAFALFTIVKIINRVSEAHEKAMKELDVEWDEKKAILKIHKEQKVSKKQAREIWKAQVAEAEAKKAEEMRLAEEKAAAEKAEAERIAEEKAMANTRLLEEIRDLLKQK